MRYVLLTISLILSASAVSAATYCGDNIKLTGERRGHYSTQSNQNVCFWACQWPKNLKKNNTEHLIDSGGHGVWKVEAKKRGLVCGQGESVKSLSGDSTVFDRNDFDALNYTQKKQLQYALKNLGYYKSSIDGLYGPNTQIAVRAYAEIKVSKRLSDKCIASAKERGKCTLFFCNCKRATNKSNNRSSNSSSSGSCQVLFRGLLGAAICSATSNPSGCMAGFAGQKPDYSSSGSENNFSYRSDSSCTRNADCGYREVCIKQYGKTRGTCMGVPSTARKGFNPNCNRDSDCVGSARCDRTYKVCVER